MSSERSDEPAEVDRILETLALSIVETCVRNTGLEDLHAGRFPRSASGDYSDVRIVTPYGDIAWTELSRISDDEMKILMIEIVDRVFTHLSFPEEMKGLRSSTAAWDRPKFNEAMMNRVRRLRASEDRADRTQG